MGFIGTPAAEYTEAELITRFDEKIIGLGQYNRRKISGTDRWSEHSWGNALDVHVSVGRADNVERANGDEIAAWLNEHKDELGIRNILWWQTNHFDHIHTDFWPRGNGTPPIRSTGIGSFKYSNSKIVAAQIQVVPMEGPGLEDGMAILSDEAQQFFEDAYQKQKADLTPPTSPAYLREVVEHLRNHPGGGGGEETHSHPATTVIGESE